jgi:hypothetical protein
MIPSRLQLKRFGPVESADISFGELTVFVGPQATGKSLTLQLVKLLADTGAIHTILQHYGTDWKGKPESFLEAVLGEGTRCLWSETSSLTVDGTAVTMAELARRGGWRNTEERVFFIPAQRVLAINPQSGWFRGFYDYRSGDPFVVRDFSEKLRRLAEEEFSESEAVFPQPRRLKKVIRKALLDAIFGGFSLRLETQMGQRRFVLRSGGGPSLPFTVWSAGQREFVPLLLGAYQLLPRAAVPRREPLELAVIEELEMGLHPQASSAAMLLVLDLLQRGYRVCLSTHSPHVLDVVWAFRRFRECGAGEQFVFELFGLPSNPESKKLAAAALDPARKTRVYYFERKHGTVRDISNLDPSSDDAAEAGWGGLTEFSGHVGNLVARAVANAKA